MTTSKNSMIDDYADLKAAVAKVLEDPRKVFEVSKEVRQLGFHAASQRLTREALAHVKESGLIDWRGSAPPGAFVAGSGQLRMWVKPTRSFDMDIKTVAKKLVG